MRDPEPLELRQIAASSRRGAASLSRRRVARRRGQAATSSSGSWKRTASRKARSSSTRAGSVDRQLDELDLRARLQLGRDPGPLLPPPGEEQRRVGREQLDEDVRDEPGEAGRREHEDARLAPRAICAGSRRRAGRGRASERCRFEDRLREQRRHRPVEAVRPHEASRRNSRSGSGSQSPRRTAAELVHVLLERRRVEDEAAVLLEQVGEVDRPLLAAGLRARAERQHRACPAIAASISALVFSATTASASARSRDSAFGSILACGVDHLDALRGGPALPTPRAQPDAGGGRSVRPGGAPRRASGRRWSRSTGATFGEEPR